MGKVCIEKKNANCISKAVSEVIHSYEDDVRFEGAYIVCGEDEGLLTHVGLHLVYIDYTFKSKVPVELVEDIYSKTGVCISVHQHPFWMYGGRPQNIYVQSLLIGDILYDKNGHLSEMKRLFELDSDRNSTMDRVVSEPPIQYKKVI